MGDRKTILAVNHDAGSAQAMIPALQVLKSEFDVVTVAKQDSPAFGAFRQAGLEACIVPNWQSDAVENFIFEKTSPHPRGNFYH